MRSVVRATLGFLSASALIGLQMFGCSAADETSDRLENTEPSGAVEIQPETSPQVTTPLDNRFADLAERFKAVDDRLDANPRDPNALAEVARLRAEVDARMNVLTTVEVSADHRVRFYEPLPGVTLVHEWFSQGAKPRPILEGLKFKSLAEVHKKLRPSESVPEVLLQADRRAAEPLNSLPSITEADVMAEEAPLVQKISSSCSEFKNAGGCPSGGADETPWCFCNITGNFTKSVTTDFADWSIAPYRGSLSLQLSVNGTVLLIDAIPQGEWHWWGTQSGKGYGDKFCNCGLWQACGSMFCYRNHSGAVLNASGDGYHYGGVFNR